MSEISDQTDETVGCGHQLHNTVGCESVDMVSEMNHNLNSPPLHSHIQLFYQFGDQMGL
jgi:hypothetical protein